MRTYNRAVVLGHAGNEPILRHTKSGKAVLNLSVATNSKRRDGPEETTWHRIVFWDRLAEIVSKRVRKGSPLYVEGSMSATEWTDREGVARRRTEIYARELVLLGPSGEDSGPDGHRVRGNSRGEDGEERGEVVVDIPF